MDQVCRVKWSTANACCLGPTYWYEKNKGDASCAPIPLHRFASNGGAPLRSIFSEISGQQSTDQ